MPTGDALTVWTLSGECDPQQLRGLLTRAQQARIDRIRQAGRQPAAALGAALQSHVLAQLCACPAEDLNFISGEHGKPRLAGDPFYFSLSHTVGCAVLVTSNKAEVGVDIESRSRQVDWRRLARHALSATEQTLLEASTDPRLEFLRRWTLKEAWLKGLGRGLGGGLSRCEFDLDQDPISGRRDDLPIRHGWQFGCLDLPTHLVAWAQRGGDQFPLVEWAPLQIETVGGRARIQAGAKTASISSSSSRRQMSPSK